MARPVKSVRRTEQMMIQCDDGVITDGNEAEIGGGRGRKFLRDADAPVVGAGFELFKRADAQPLGEADERDNSGGDDDWRALVGLELHYRAGKQKTHSNSRLLWVFTKIRSVTGCYCP